MARESKGSGDIGFSMDFPVLDSRTFGLHVCSRNVYILYGIVNGAVEPGFEESLSGINLENVSFRAEQKEAIRDIVVLKKDTNFLPALASH